MGKFIFVSVFFLIWLILLAKRKKNLLYPSVFLILIYTISTITSYPHVILNNEPLSLGSEYTNASIVYILLLLLFFTPFISYREDKIGEIVLPDIRFLKILSVCLIILSLYSIVYFTPTVIRIFSMEDLRAARLQMTGGESFVEESIYNTIASVSASFYPFVIFLFFIYRALGINKNLSYLLLLSSTSYVFNVFAYVGRDGVVFWLFTFLAIFGLLSRFLPITEKKKIFRIIFLFLIIALPLFFAITMDRFSDNPFAGIISYIGQPFSNFCLFYNLDLQPSNGSSFSLFRSILGLPSVTGEKWETVETSSWVFGTFLKSFISNFGVIGTIIIGFSLGLVFYTAFRKGSYNFYFYQFFLYIMYFQIFSQGVFYFRHYTRGGNLFIILCFLFYLVFNIFTIFQSKFTYLYPVEEQNKM